MESLQYGFQQGYNPQFQAFNPQQGYNPQSQAFNPQQVYNPATNGGTQFSPWQIGQQGPGWLSGGNAPFGGLIGSGIGGLMGAQNIGRQPGQLIDGVAQQAGNLDAVAVQLQQAQLAQQLAQQVYQQAHLAQQLAQQQLGRLGLDPISAAIVQQRAQFGQQGHLAPMLGVNPLSRIDPLTAAYSLQGQIAQLCQQLAIQNQFGQSGQYGLGHGQLGQGQAGLNATGYGQTGLGGQNLWATPQFATQLGRFQSTPYGLMGAVGGYGASPFPIN